MGDIKRLLKEYTDAQKCIEVLEREIKILEKKMGTLVTDTVMASNEEFPYQMTSCKIVGINQSKRKSFENRIDKKKIYIESKKDECEEIIAAVEEWIGKQTPRIGIIVRLKYFEGMKWEQVAAELGGRATGESVRMELQRAAAGRLG